MTFPSRYLVPFGPKQTPHVFTDVLIIGGGIAGLRAALAVPPSMHALVVTKDVVQLSNSSWAQGGIATVLAPEDRFENHIEDTLTAGAGLCDRAVVEMVVRDAPEQLAQLIDWGTHFDLENGHLALGREGGHSHHRIVHALGDATGFEVMRAMIERVRQAPNVTIWEKTFTLDLLVHEGRCAGVHVARPRKEKTLVWAKQTVLASGGCGLIYRETTNPPVATGDGMAAAYRAGAELRDMEFMQFHPTVLYVAGSSRHLISEAVRGEGAYLRDKNGDRFMPAEDPRAELAPRDVVAQAIVRTMERTQHPNVYLDLSHLPPSRVLERFPGIAKVCRDFGLDITHDLIPVRPGAHYMVGGVTVDPEGRTSLPGLWGAGEVTSSGLHGANRLASNSLLEGLVYGTTCGRAAAEAAARMPDTFQVPPLEFRRPRDRSEPLDVADVTNSLRSLMVRRMGIVRDAAGLREGERQVAFWCRYALPRVFDSRAGSELQNLLTIARLMIRSAREREESRGVHFRSDFPQRDDAHWLRHVVCPASLLQGTPMDVVWQELSAGWREGEALVRVAVRLVVAAALGGVLGWERQYEHKYAGVRTHMLVALGSALFTAAPLLGGVSADGVTRIIQGVAAGIGFVGGGTILKLTGQQEVRGLTTAANIWLAAAVGVAVGAGWLVPGVLGTVLALLILFALGRFERWCGMPPGR